VKRLITSQNYELLTKKNLAEYLKGWHDSEADLSSQPIWSLPEEIMEEKEQGACPLGAKRKRTSKKKTKTNKKVKQEAVQEPSKNKKGKRKHTKKKKKQGK
jgi:hypothetical protein